MLRLRRKAENIILSDQKCSKWQQMLHRSSVLETMVKKRMAKEAIGQDTNLNWILKSAPKDQERNINLYINQKLRKI